MGILDLFPLLREECPDLMNFQYHLSEFPGYRVAIDISIFLYRYIRSAGPKRWVDPFISFLCCIRKHGLRPICIFDGPNPPIEKREEQMSRRDSNAKALSKLAECRKLMKILQEEYLPNNKPLKGEIRDQCKALLEPKYKNHREVKVISYSSCGEVYDALASKIEKLEFQTVPITKDFAEEAQKIVRAMNISCFVAAGEAEALCAYLAVKGDVDIVLTEDTDVLAYGTPFMIAFKTGKLQDEKVTGIHLPMILERLGLTQAEFTDLCILLGCDYNKNNGRVKIPAKTKGKFKSVGMKTAYEYITEYRTLDKIDEWCVDSTPLNYERCRELFSVPKKIPEIYKIHSYKEPDYDSLHKLLLKHKTLISIDYIRKIFKPAKITFGNNVGDGLINDEDYQDDDFEEEIYDLD